MADYYVKSSTGLDTNDGLSWATAKATVAGVIAIPCLAGDRIFIPASHLETQTTTKTLAFPGTPSQPNQIIAVADDDATTLAVGGTIATSASSGVITLNGSYVLQGATIASGSNVQFAQTSSPDSAQKLDNCSVYLNGGVSSAAVIVATTNSANASRNKVTFRNFNVRFSHTGQHLEFHQPVIWQGGKATSTVTGPTYLLRVGSSVRASSALIEGVDLSELSASMSLVSGPTSVGNATFRNCKLPVGWSGGLVSGAHPLGMRITMHNCDSADTNYRMLVGDYYGQIRSETAVIKTSGATAYSTGFSWVMASNANTSTGLFTLDSDEIFHEVSTAGTLTTISVDVLTDGVTLTNADAWLDVQYLGTSGVPLGALTAGRYTTLSAPTTIPTSTATWNTTGLTNPVKQKLSVSFTPRKAGFVHVRVMLARPNTALYVDPLVQVS